MYIKYYIEKLDGTGKVELPQISGDVTKPTFNNMGEGNPRLVSAKELIEKCTKLISQGKKAEQNVFFIYRGVAIGGLQRKLGGFASKPLTVKEKSIDPTLLNTDDAFKRLTGLIPMVKRLGKGGHDSDPTIIQPDENQLAYRIVQEDTEVGKEKKYLYCHKGKRTLTWVSSIDIDSSKYDECNFLGSKLAAYLADWDLVLVGATKRNSGEEPIYNVVKKEEAGIANILPQWLADNLKVQDFTQVTQHGPESLYCGNDITGEDEFLVVTQYGTGATHVVIDKDTPNLNGNNPWEKTQDYVQTNLSNGYVQYKFDQFNGKPVDLTPEQKKTAIEELNKAGSSYPKNTNDQSLPATRNQQQFSHECLDTSSDSSVA